MTAAAGGDGWDVLLNMIFYILFAPACGGMMNRIMYASQALMAADAAIRQLNLILEQKPLAEPAHPQSPSCLLDTSRQEGEGGGSG